MFVSEEQGPGDILVTLPEGGRLWVRYPSWLSAGDLSLEASSGGDLRATRIGDWAVTPTLGEDAAVRVVVPQIRHEREEWVYWQRYRMVFAGDTIVEMSPRGEYAPMFDQLTAES